MANESEWLAERFEAHRAHLRGVAYRMLGSLAEADDAVQEAWLRLSRSGAGGVENLGGWLTTVVARVCLDMLRSHTSRREEPLDEQVAGQAASREDGLDPEYEAQLADSVGLALLVVLDTLAPAERLAFVLHDMFDMSFGEIAPILGRSPAAARQLASRARRRVRGGATVLDAGMARQRDVIEAFLAALRGGDFEALVALLDPDVVVRAGTREVRGASTWARQALGFSKVARFARPALVNGTVGVVMAPRGRLFRALSFTFAHDRIVRIDVVADPGQLRRLDLAVLPEDGTEGRPPE